MENKHGLKWLLQVFGVDAHLGLMLLDVVWRQINGLCMASTDNDYGWMYCAELLPSKRAQFEVLLYLLSALLRSCVLYGNGLGSMLVLFEIRSVVIHLIQSAAVTSTSQQQDKEEVLQQLSILHLVCQLAYSANSDSSM